MLKICLRKVVQSPYARTPGCTSFIIVLFSSNYCFVSTKLVEDLEVFTLRVTLFNAFVGDDHDVRCEKTSTARLSGGLGISTLYAA